MAYSEHNVFLSLFTTTLVRTLLFSHFFIIISTNAKPTSTESPEEAAARQQLYLRILGIDPDTVGTSSNRLNSNSDLPPATPFPSIILAPDLNSRKPVEKMVDPFELPLNNNNNRKQFQSVQAPKNPFVDFIDDKKQVQTRRNDQSWPKPPAIPSSANAGSSNVRTQVQTGQSWPWLTPPAIPSSANAGSSNDGKRVLRQADKRWSYPTPPEIPSSSSNAGAMNQAIIAERNQPVLELVDVLPPTIAPRAILYLHARPLDKEAVPLITPLRKQELIAQRKLELIAQQNKELVAEQSYQELIFDPKNKVGRCPSLFGGIKMCRDSCKGDADCDAEQKCCWDGCEHACVMPQK